uniref:Disease resistance R13L4/SHOC-2-like LRR domain-containing protein n=1 Tax=Arundo donax TaxID=35708 RepID=A0A0A9CEB5_ARUDO
MSSEEFWSAIASLNHLQSLSVNWQQQLALQRYLVRRTLDGRLGGSLLPPRSIESLKLKGRLVKFTQWIHHLQNLSKLQLLQSKLQQDAVQDVGKLPNLAVLRTGWNAFKGEELVFKQGSFPCLILLELFCDFPYVKFEDGTTPKLELLRIAGLEQFQELSGVRYLTKLKEIRLDLRLNEKKF